MARPASPSTRSARCCGWLRTSAVRRVKRILAADPAVERPATVQLNIDLNGLIRAQAAGETMREAIHHACDRLRVWIERAARNWAAIRDGQPVPAFCEWRHWSRPSPQLPYFPRPPEVRTVMRRKSYAVAPPGREPGQLPDAARS